jgi:undecaprenyl-diphosphatase
MNDVAAFLGRYDMAVFTGFVLSALAGTVIAWRLVETGTGALRPATAARPGRRMAFLACVGLPLVCVAVALFIAIAASVDMRAGETSFDRMLSDSLASARSRPAAALFGAITHFGDTAVLTALGIVVALALFLYRQWPLALAWSLTLAGHGLLNPRLKAFFQRARPLHDGVPIAGDWSFPSGHAAGAMVAYGLLAWLALRLLPPRWRLPAVMTAVVIIAMVGFSRMVLRVHFASDVVAGYLSGLAWLTSCMLLAEAFLAERERRAAARTRSAD